MTEKDKPIVAIDFDGVINNYKGWKGENHLSTPRSGVNYFLKKINENYDIVIFTCRDNRKVRDWLHTYDLDQYILSVSMTKPQAVAYIDDRAIRYEGKYDDVLQELDNFKAWWEE